MNYQNYFEKKWLEKINTRIVVHKKQYMSLRLKIVLSPLVIAEMLSIIRYMIANSSIRMWLEFAMFRFLKYFFVKMFLKIPILQVK